VEDGVHTLDGTLQGVAVEQVALNWIDLVRGQQSRPMRTAHNDAWPDSFGAQLADELDSNEAGGAGYQDIPHWYLQNALGTPLLGGD
jgi:hypothetical protein